MTGHPQEPNLYCSLSVSVGNSVDVYSGADLYPVFGCCLLLRPVCPRKVSTVAETMLSGV